MIGSTLVRLNTDPRQPSEILSLGLTSLTIDELVGAEGTVATVSVEIR